MSNSVWLAELNGDAGQVRDFVIARMQVDDIVTVVELKSGSDWAVSPRTSPLAMAWLSAKVTPSRAAA